VRRWFVSCSVSAVSARAAGGRLDLRHRLLDRLERLHELRAALGEGVDVLGERLELDRLRDFGEEALEAIDKVGEPLESERHTIVRNAGRSSARALARRGH
jgi:hypothetical protein